jgi:DNA-binding LacI/PurR family transcriptional regulator
VRILIGLINEPSRPAEPVHLLLPTQLIVRRSSAPPAR